MIVELFFACALINATLYKTKFRLIICRFGKTGDPYRILAFHCNSRVQCLLCCFYTSSVSNLYEIQAAAVTWSAIISCTTVDNFVRRFKSRDSETSFLEEYFSRKRREY